MQSSLEEQTNNLSQAKIELEKLKSSAVIDSFISPLPLADPRAGTYL
jgi:hypothetical protein